MEDRYNMATGYLGRAAERLATLEAIESDGDVIIIQDFTNNETIRGIIEEQQFVRMTAPDRAFNGDGGMIYCTIRTARHGKCGFSHNRIFLLFCIGSGTCWRWLLCKAYHQAAYGRTTRST